PGLRPHDPVRFQSACLLEGPDRGGCRLAESPLRIRSRVEPESLKPLLDVPYGMPEVAKPIQAHERIVRGLFVVPGTWIRNPPESQAGRGLFGFLPQLLGEYRRRRGGGRFFPGWTFETGLVAA